MAKRYLKVPLMIPNVKNANGLIYTKEAIANAYQQFRQKCESQGCMLGELSGSNAAYVNLAHATHTIQDPEMTDDGALLGTISLLDTLGGCALQEKIHKANFFEVEPNTNLELAVYPRGYGKIKNNLVTDFTLISFDLSSFDLNYRSNNFDTLTGFILSQISEARIDAALLDWNDEITNEKYI